MLVQFSM